MYIYHISINGFFPSDAIAIESHILQRQVNQNNIQFKSWPYPKGTKAIFCIHQIKCQIIVIPIYFKNEIRNIYKTFDIINNKWD